MTELSMKELDARLARLERMDAIEKLIKRVGHDFNNLFGIVIGAAGVLREEISDRPELTELKTIIADTESAGREGAEILARLFACVGHQTLHATRIQPIPLIEKVINEIRSRIDERVAVEVALASNAPSIYIDPDKLEVALQALLDNALEAMEAGGSLKISTEVRLRGELDSAAPGSDTLQFLGITVSDTGEGIEPGLLSRVTDPYFTTRKPPRDRGLGLSLAYGYALQSGGSLSIDAAPGHGTTATLWLPATEDDRTGDV